MNTKRNNKGFTMMEMLVAIGIIVALMGVAFVGIINYQRTFKQKELDGTARELFVAAQNHLTMAQSQGNLQGLSQGWQLDDAAEDDTVFYYFVEGSTATQLDSTNSDSRSSALYQMLPQFSIDDTVRRGGSYVIKYNTETATVLDVFYSDHSNLSDHTFVSGDYEALFVKPGYTGDDNASSRLEGYDGAIIGWYGGDDLETAAPDDVIEPTISVSNAEVLQATIEMPSTSGASGTAIQLIIEGDTSGVSRLVEEYSLADFQSHFDSAKGVYCLTVVLDDITSNKGHFAQQPWCEDDKTTSVAEGVLIPGENITLYARVYSNEVLSKVVTSAKKHTNSLFAEIIDEEVAAAVAGQPATTQKVAQVTSIRHLENLDPAISSYAYETMGDDAAYVAEQGSDLQWSGDTGAFLEQIIANDIRTGSESKTDDVLVYYAGGSTYANAGTYAPVNPTYLTEYDGLNHTISNVKVSTADEAGLFGTINVASSSIHDLKLVDFNIASTGKNAGALAGNVSGTITVSNVLAYNSSSSVTKENSAIKGSTAAGGLVGSLTNATLTESGAAMYVEANGTGDTCVAGGLVGTSSGGSITKSYAAGHLIEASTTTDDPKQITYDTAAGNVLASGSKGIAGGLVGLTASTPVQYCYSTCSSFATNTAGGLVGSVSGSSVQNCYATGLVGGKDGTTTMATNAGAFAGVVSNNAAFKDDSYLAIINEKNNVAGLSTDDVDGISLADADTATYKAFSAGSGAATPYASVLTQYYKGKYNFKTADELASATNGTSASATHYGDWPTPETLVLNTKGSTSISYDVSLSPEGIHYVGDTDTKVTLSISEDGGTTYKTYTGSVTWTSGDPSKVQVTSTEAEAPLTLVGAGTVKITATISGKEVGSVDVTVVAKTPTVLVPSVGDGAEEDHSNGYLAYKNLNSLMYGGVTDIKWVQMYDHNNVPYLALRYHYGDGGDYRYGVIYYNGQYYKAINENGDDAYGHLVSDNFYITYLGKDYYYDQDTNFGIKIKWVPIDPPTDVVDPNSGPGTRDLEQDSSKWNYKADMWLANGFQDNRTFIEWEPFQDGCMVAVRHDSGTDSAGAVWYNNEYYIPQSSEGNDTFIQLLGTGFSHSDLLDNKSHTYGSTTVTWLKIPNPYGYTEVLSSDNPPTIGQSLTSADAYLCKDIADNASQFTWYQYRDGCVIAAHNNSNEWERSAPVIWYKGKYYRPKGSDNTAAGLTIGKLNHYFYTSDLTDGVSHNYGGTAVEWEEIDVEALKPKDNIVGEGTYTVKYLAGGQYGISFKNNTAAYSKSVTVVFSYRGTVASVSGNINSWHADSTNHMLYITFNNYGNGFQAGETVADVYTVISGEGFAFAT